MGFFVLKGSVKHFYPSITDGEAVWSVSDSLIIIRYLVTKYLVRSISS